MKAMHIINVTVLDRLWTVMMLFCCYFSDDKLTDTLETLIVGMDIDMSITGCVAAARDTRSSVNSFLYTVFYQFC